MSPYRERREARAERLREWAAKRETKAEAAFNTAESMAAVIPFGQPILAGHHSERRDRRYRDRIGRNMDRGLDHSRKAADMASRADGIEAAAERAIYSDDPDAIERLAKRIAELEAERDSVKERNAAYRKEHRAELAAMTAYQRSQAVPHPSYELQNLGGNIGRQRKRLAELEREAEHGPRLRLIVAKYRGTCDKCHGEIEPGNRILYAKGHTEHVEDDCLTGAPRLTPTV
jgi:hypothetical protein